LLVQNGLITKPSEIFWFLDIDFQYRVQQLPGWSDGRVAKIIKSIKEKRNITAHKFYMCLGIPTIAEAKSVELYSIEPSPKNLPILFQEGKISRIKMIGDVCYGKLEEYMRSNIAEYYKILQQVNIVEKKVAANQSTFLFTGTLSQPRSIFEDKAIKAGHKVTKGISRGVTYLVAGEKAGSKLQKAKELNIRIINESSFIELISK